MELLKNDLMPSVLEDTAQKHFSHPGNMSKTENQHKNGK